DEPPTVVSCPSKIEVTSNDVREAVFWDEPQFEDNSGRPVSIVQTHRSGDVFVPGRHTVTYQAIDYNNNKNTCVFDVIMTRNTCPYYPAPTNGALSCSDWLFGQICQTFCNEKYDFVETPAEWYICNENSVWVTMPVHMPIPWPDCSSRTPPHVPVPTTITAAESVGWTLDPSPCTSAGETLSPRRAYSIATPGPDEFWHLV
ncbi:Sushi, von Willebrand factor type A, EGF and pentraxin domain-containing protein 1, partial [Araneus ventricosus]